MLITLNHTEISESISEFIGNKGIDLSGKDIEVNLIAGRGPNGHTATVEIIPAIAKAMKKAKMEDPVVEPTDTSVEEAEETEVSDDDQLFSNP